MTRKAPFTLLEMLVVMMLLSIMAGVVSLQMVSSSKGEQFKAATELVLERIRLAQEMMMLGKDLTLSMEKIGEKEWMLEMVPKIKGDHSAHKLLTTRQKITGIESMIYTGGDTLDLPFISKGGQMPQGDLIFHTGSHTRVLRLPGYPSFLSFHPQKEPLPSAKELYPLEVREKYAQKTTTTPLHTP